MRSAKALRNVFSGWLGQLIMIIITLCSRKIFLKSLGEEYLGLNGLLTNVVSFLSMADMGIGTAISFSLYKPLAEDDIKSLKSLMKVFKRIYCFTGALIIVLGGILLPFLPGFIPNAHEIENLNSIYLIFLLNTGVSYFFSYKGILITADQEGYVFSINHYFWQFFLIICQMIVIVLTKNYYFFIILMLVATIFENYTIARIANRKYPFLLERYTGKINNKTKNEIKENTYSIILSRIGSTIVNSTDNILISSFEGLSMVGLYNNYSTISKAVGTVFLNGLNALVPSVGNLSIQDNGKRSSEIFGAVYLVSVWMYGWASICLCCLLTPFVEIFYGADYSINNVIVLISCVNTLVSGQMAFLGVQISAMGLYKQIKYVGIVEAIINFVFSWILGVQHGILGVLLGTLISNVGWSIWIEAKIVLMHISNTTFGHYLIWLLKDFILVFMVGGITYYMTDFLKENNITSFILKCGICVIVPNIIFFVVYFRTRHFIVLKNVLFNIIVRKCGKKENN